MSSAPVGFSTARDLVGVDPNALPPGTRLDAYTIVRRFAVGGMAEVYLASLRGTAGFEKVFALKRIRPVLASDVEFVDMFLREASIAALLDHPNIARVIDVGQVGVEYYFVMEFVHGESLRVILREASQRGGIPLDCALSLVHGVARGLHHAHEAARPSGESLLLVHRDVSPSNVLVSFQGDVKVVDFGIAKALAETCQTRASVFKGKIGYMSPEQCRGQRVDRRSDVFGLGILLYEATTCRRLFSAESQFAVMNMIVRGEFVRPSDVVPGYPADLEEVVMRALAVDPALRHPTALALQADLEAVAGRLGSPLSPRALEDMMRSFFGTRPLPSAELPESVEVTAREPSRAGWSATSHAVVPRPRRWGRAIATATALAAGLGAAVALGWWIRPIAAHETGAVTLAPAMPPAMVDPAMTPATSAPAAMSAVTPTMPRVPTPEERPMVAERGAMPADERPAAAAPKAEPSPAATAGRRAEAKRKRPPSRRSNARRAGESRPRGGTARPLFPDGL